ncbi:hypothetical protein DQG23_15905 [Paenibacillus contaminans]|uniref:Uncharacterized protein n=1 Tax=Paenibacillus contaminans TaxID=450362 RepID=A0A329MKW5_9BACL|nr:hypothetical protein DQG23_15905 [Paenibacillus contaminans]
MESDSSIKPFDPSKIDIKMDKMWKEYLLNGIYIVLDPDIEDKISTEVQLNNISNVDQIALLQSETIEHILSAYFLRTRLMG